MAAPWKNVTNWVFGYFTVSTALLSLLAWRAAPYAWLLTVPLFVGLLIAWPLVLWRERVAQQKFQQLTPYQRSLASQKNPVIVGLIIVFFLIFIVMLFI